MGRPGFIHDEETEAFYATGEISILEARRVRVGVAIHRLAPAAV
jgi:hypothetical protein